MAKKPSAAQLLNSLAASASEKPTTKSNSNPPMPVSPELGQAVESFAASTIGSKILSSQAEQEKAEVYRLGLDQFVWQWFEAKQKPANPTFSTPVASCVLQVKSKVKINVPQDSSVGQELKARGIEPAKCVRWSKLVQRTESVTTKPFHTLLAGSEAEQAAAQKLMKLIVENMSAEERALVLQKVTTTTVDDETLFAKLAEESGSVEEMQTVLEVMSPEIAVSSVKHSDALGVVQARLADAQQVEAKQAA